jgi:(R,R)-butanediol dehydrogenase/meso-butanediol dehydrogenase/diacetyl reductase
VRAARYYGRGDLRLEEVPEPEAGPGDVKLRVLYAGICGSDLHEYYAGPIWTRADEPHPATGVRNPVVLGHELCGEVVEVGRDVTGFEPGDLVAVEASEPCGQCDACRAGRPCPQRPIHGYTRPGGAFSDFTVVSRGMAHRLPEGMTPQQGALIEPMAVGLSAALRAGADRIETAAVHGLGPIGLGAALSLRARGVEAIVSDPSEQRRAAAEQLGFEHVLDPRAVDVVEVLRGLTDGWGVHASIDAAGVPAALEAAVSGTRIEGDVVQVAVPLEPVVLPASFRASRVRLTASAPYEFPPTIAGMARGDYPLGDWVSTIGFDDMLDEGFEALHRQEKVKVLVDMGGAPG